LSNLSRQFIFNLSPATTYSQRIPYAENISVSASRPYVPAVLHFQPALTNKTYLGLSVKDKLPKALKGNFRLANFSALMLNSFDFYLANKALSGLHKRRRLGCKGILRP